MVLVYSLGHISGAQFNPSVSTGLWGIGKLKKDDYIFYLISQALGALLAALTLKALLAPSNVGSGGGASGLNPIQIWFTEFLGTFLLAFTVTAVATDKRAQAPAGLAIGGALAAGITLAGPISGASFNPAISLGASLASGDFHNLWIYLTAPLAAGWCASQAYDLLRGGGQ
jgi:glycerol uptake facilitator-like aquaporin